MDELHKPQRFVYVIKMILKILRLFYEAFVYADANYDNIYSTV